MKPGEVRRKRKQKEVLKGWLDGEYRPPCSLWMLGNDLYSYGLRIAIRESDHVKLIVRPRVSVTTQKHRGLVRAACKAAKIPVQEIVK